MKMGGKLEVSLVIIKLDETRKGSENKGLGFHRYYCNLITLMSFRRRY